MVKKLIYCSLFIISCAHVIAQEIVKDTLKATELTEVVLTATRTARQLSSLPLPVTIISKKNITNSGTVRLNEILNEQTGIVTVPDESGFEGIQIQGILSEHILMLIDGVPLIGRSSGNFDLSRLTVGNIKQIEIVKGPSSSLYGSEALGGVINIITETPNNKILKGNLSYRIGSFTQQDINLDFKQQIGKFKYIFFANRFSSNGYDLTPNTKGKTVDPFRNYTFSGKGIYDFSNKTSLFTSLRYYKQAQDTELYFNNGLFEGDSKEEEINAHIKLDQQWNHKFDIDYELYYTNYKTRELLINKENQEILNDNFYNQNLLRPEIRSHYTFDSFGTITLGLGIQYNELDRTFFDSKISFNSQYIYAQYDVNPVKNLNIIAGARFDNHSEYSNQFSPKFAARYKLTKTIAIKGSVGYGFKAPDFRQLYFDFTNSTVGYTVLGNNVALEKLQELNKQGQILEQVISQNELEDVLEPESSIGYNLGITLKKYKWNTELNFFRNDFRNQIDTRIIARKTNGQNVFSYINHNKTYTTGLELNTSYNAIKNLQISAGYQLLYAFDKEKNKEVENNKAFVRDPKTNKSITIENKDYFGLFNRSKHTANFKVSYEIPKLKTNINARILYRSKYAQFDTNGNGFSDSYDTSFIDGYTITNISANQTFFTDFNLHVGVNNLFDYTNNDISSQPGIQGYLKLNYKF